MGEIPEGKEPEPGSPNSVCSQCQLISELCMEGTESQHLKQGKRIVLWLMNLLYWRLLSWIHNILRQTLVEWKLAWRIIDEEFSFSIFNFTMKLIVVPRTHSASRSTHRSASAYLIWWTKKEKPGNHEGWREWGILIGKELEKWSQSI